MFVRIVKMSFEPSKIEEFIALFETHKMEIRSFSGCELLELYRDKFQDNIFFTYSVWKSETHLELYRQSALFQKVWSHTKSLFNAKPEAWSVDKVVSMT